MTASVLPQQPGVYGVAKNGRVIPTRTGRQQQKLADIPARQETEPLPEQERERFHLGHFLTQFGIGMLIVIVAIAIWNMVIVPKWQEYQDQLHYGDGRISKLDADVGHGGISTFLAFDLGRQITIIELPGGEIDHSRMYRTGSLIGADSEHRVITLEVHNVKGYGKPDIVIRVEGMSEPITLYNNGNSFQWTLPQ